MATNQVQQYGLISLEDYSRNIAIATKHMTNSNKNTINIYVVANVINSYAKFQLHPPYGFWEDFWIFI